MVVAKERGDPHFMMGRVTTYVLEEPQSETTHFNMDGRNADALEDDNVMEGMVVNISLDVMLFSRDALPKHFTSER